MLLDIVSLAGDERRDDSARRQPHTRRLSLARIGLLGSDHADLDANALQHGRLDGGQGGGGGVACSLLFTAALEGRGGVSIPGQLRWKKETYSHHLHEGGILGGCGGKGPRSGEFREGNYRGWCGQWPPQRRGEEVTKERRRHGGGGLLPARQLGRSAGRDARDCSCNFLAHACRHVIERAG